MSSRADNWPPRSVAAYSFRPLGHAQLTVVGVVGLAAALNSASGAVSVPPDAVMVLIACEVQGVRWTDDGQTPTASFGIPMAVGQEFAYSGNLNGILFAAMTGTPVLDIAYYK
jgi:hypothetical protein